MVNEITDIYPDKNGRVIWLCVGGVLAIVWQILIVLKPLEWGISTAILIAGLVLVTYPEIFLGFAVAGSSLVYFLFLLALGIGEGARILTYVTASMVFVLYILARGTFVRLRGLPIVMIAMTVLLCIGNLYTNSPNYGCRKALLFIMMCTFPFLVGYQLSSVWHRLHKFYMVILCFGICLALGSIVLMMLGVIDVAARFALVVENPIWFARLMGTSVLILLYLMSIHHSYRVRLMSGIAILLIIPPLLVTGSRGPVLALIIVLFVSLFLSSSRERIKQRIAAFVIVLATVGLAFFLVGKQFIIVQRLVHFGGLSSALRLRHFATAWRLFLDSPIIGHGTGGYAVTSIGRDIRFYPHNVFLEILSELGIVGGFVLATFIVLTSLAAFRLLFRLRIPPEERELAALCILIFIFAFANSLVSGDLPLNSYFWFVPGMIWGLYDRFACRDARTLYKQAETHGHTHET
jgi:O-antigen ligase